MVSDMAELTLSYQALLETVYTSACTKDHVFPNGFSYVALPIAEVRAIVKANSPGNWSAEAYDCNDKARRLWHSFKEHHSLCACGIVRLRAPVAHDIVGIITAEDLKTLGPDTPEQKLPAPSYLVDRDLLDDEISEIRDEILTPPGGSWMGRLGVKRPQKDLDLAGMAGDELSAGLEMTFIEPQTGEIFKRSRGGTFGVGGWPVSEIRAYAVWF
jgi:hypothetical protein